MWMIWHLNQVVKVTKLSLFHHIHLWCHWDSGSRIFFFFSFLFSCREWFHAKNDFHLLLGRTLLQVIIDSHRYESLDVSKIQVDDDVTIILEDLEMVGLCLDVFTNLCHGLLSTADLLGKLSWQRSPSNQLQWGLNSSLCLLPSRFKGCLDICR